MFSKAMFLYPTHVTIQSYSCLSIAVNEWHKSFLVKRLNSVIKKNLVYGSIMLLYFQQKDRDIEISVNIGQIQNIF